MLHIIAQSMMKQVLFHSDITHCLCTKQLAENGGIQRLFYTELKSQTCSNCSWLGICWNAAELWRLFSQTLILYITKWNHWKVLKNHNQMLVEEPRKKRRALLLSKCFKKVKYFQPSMINDYHSTVSLIYFTIIDAMLMHHFFLTHDFSIGISSTAIHPLVVNIKRLNRNQVIFQQLTYVKFSRDWLRPSVGRELVLTRLTWAKGKAFCVGVCVCGRSHSFKAVVPCLL